MGASGATDVAEYLSKTTNSLWDGPEPTQKLLLFTIFISSRKSYD